MATTQSSLEVRATIGLLVSLLPRTLHDAVIVAKNLGLQFLWIDSLCIVQDDNADVQRELPKMADIYGGLYVTISAASARNCEEGFLQDWMPSGNRRHIIALPLRCLDGQMGRLYFHPQERHDHSIRDPISERAWTLQEYLLSPRMLIYGSRQLNWVCRAEEDWNGDPRNFQTGLAETLSNRLFCADEGQGRLEQLWPTIVQEHSRRNLSNPTDRAPAILGIATQYAKLSGKTYIAGLWKENIAWRLLWRRPLEAYFNTIPSKSSRRAPSWSWISVDDEVFWQYDHSVVTSLKLISHDIARFGGVFPPEEFPLLVEGRLRDAYYETRKPSIIIFHSTRNVSSE